MKGIVMCQKCKHHQPWISQSRFQLGNIATSNCRKCSKRNRFYPHRFGSQGNLVERRGRKPSVHFRRRPNWTITPQMIAECRARNRGYGVDEDEMMSQETEEFRERVQNRINELQKVKEALE